MRARLEQLDRTFREQGYTAAMVEEARRIAGDLGIAPSAWAAPPSGHKPDRRVDLQDYRKRKRDEQLRVEWERWRYQRSKLPRGKRGPMMEVRRTGAIAFASKEERANRRPPGHEAGGGCLTSLPQSLPIWDTPARSNESVDARSTSEVEGAVERWSVGLDEETEFWLRWLRDHGGPWPEDYKLRTDPDAELQSHIARFLDPSAGGPLRILDVGSGPLTVLGKRWGDRKLEITAVDPLADSYAELFERVGLDPLVRPVGGEAEHVADLFPPDSFDLVYAQNCIDHGYDPLRSIEQMLRLVRPGRFLMLEHALDECEYMKYAGPHQWNFREEGGRFIIWRPGLRVDAHTKLEKLARVQIEPNPDARWLVVALQKRAPQQSLLRRVRDRFLDS